MAIGNAMVLITSVILLGILAGVVLLQIFLSKRESKWLGLILPAITFFYAIIMILSVVIYDGMGSGEILATIGGAFLLGNIPTIVLLGIYFACREKKKRRSQLEKMNIQDLE